MDEQALTAHAKAENRETCSGEAIPSTLIASVVMDYREGARVPSPATFAVAGW